MAEGNCEMLAGGKTDINQGTLPLKMGVRVILLWMIKEGLVPKRRFVTPLRPPPLVDLSQQRVASHLSFLCPSQFANIVAKFYRGSHPDTTGNLPRRISQNHPRGPLTPPAAIAFGPRFRHGGSIRPRNITRCSHSTSPVSHDWSTCPGSAGAEARAQAGASG